MKRFLPLILTFCLALTLQTAYSQDYMDDISNKTCECIDKILASNEAKNLEMRLGACMIQAATPYEKQIKKDFKVDLAKIDEQGDELGKILGIKIAGNCTNSFMAIVDMMEKEEAGVTAQDKTLEGTVTDINNQQFVIFTVKDESGKFTNLYWLSFFPSDVNLSSNYQQIKNKRVKLSYREQEFFDPRINEYKKYNVITAFESLK